MGPRLDDCVASLDRHMPELVPVGASLMLKWPGLDWHHGLADFTEGARSVSYEAADEPDAEIVRVLEGLRPCLAAGARFGELFAPPPVSHKLDARGARA